MNRKNLTAAVLAGLAGAAGIAGTAQAVNINPDGLGQVLIYPYYTVNNGNNTLLSVVNTSEDAQAVKVRFLEGQNSREVLDFNLYLSPYDVWTGAVVSMDQLDDKGEFVQADVPHLLSGDNSCTVPYLYRDFPAQPFLNLALNDGGSTDISGRGSEGYVEVISMGKITDDTKGTATAVTHTTVGATETDPGTWQPANCQQLINAWTDNTDPTKRGYWIEDWYDTGNQVDSYGYTDIGKPQGGLFGGGSIVNVPNGTLFTYDARALNGFDDSTSGHLHARPGLIEPNLASGDQHTAIVFLDNGVDQREDFTNSIDAVSYVFMHDAVMNEYITLKDKDDPTRAIGETEWVLTMPTKSFYVHEDKAEGAVGNALTQARRPFTDVWDDKDGTGACEPVTLATVWDQDEQDLEGQKSPDGKPIPPVVSPSLPGTITTDATIGFELCWEAQVIRFGTFEGADAEPPLAYSPPTEILGSNNVVNFDNEAVGFEAGWARIDLHNYRIDDNGSGNPGKPDGVINDDDTPRRRHGLVGNQDKGLTGLPVTGFAVNRFTNGFLDEGRTLANYGGIFNHKATRGMCSGESSTQSTEGDGDCNGGTLIRKPAPAGE